MSCLQVSAPRWCSPRGGPWPNCLSPAGIWLLSVFNPILLGKNMTSPGLNFPSISCFSHLNPLEPEAGFFSGELRAIRKLPHSPALKSSRMKPNICFQMGGFWSWLHIRALGWRFEFWPFWGIVFEAGPPSWLPSPCSADSKAMPCPSWHLLCCWWKTACPWVFGLGFTLSMFVPTRKIQ